VNHFRTLEKTPNCPRNGERGTSKIQYLRVGERVRIDILCVRISLWWHDYPDGQNAIPWSCVDAIHIGTPV
jgi:hypothetical protein